MMLLLLCLGFLSLSRSFTLTRPESPPSPARKVKQIFANRSDIAPVGFFSIRGRNLSHATTLSVSFLPLTFSLQILLQPLLFSIEIDQTNYTKLN